MKGRKKGREISNKSEEKEGADDEIKNGENGKWRMSKKCVNGMGEKEKNNEKEE